MNRWSLYLIRTRSGMLYTGITTDVARRFAEHEGGGVRSARSLRGKGPLELVYSAEVEDRVTAARLEYAVKRWPRQKKEALVAGQLSLTGLR